MLWVRAGQSREEAEDRAEREWLIELPAPGLPPPFDGEGRYAALVRQLDDDNGHVVYAGDKRAAESSVQLNPALAREFWRTARAKWLVSECKPIVAEHALAVVLTALRRNPETTGRRFAEARLDPGTEAIRNGAHIS